MLELDQGLPTSRIAIGAEGSKPNQRKRANNYRRIVSRGDSLELDNDNGNSNNKNNRPNKHKNRKRKNHSNQADNRSTTGHAKKHQNQQHTDNNKMTSNHSMQLQLRQQPTQTNTDGNHHGTTANKTKKKKQKKKPSPPPPTNTKQKPICIAEKSIIEYIELKRSLDGGHEANTVVDLPKDQINFLPDVPYRQTKNAIVVISNAAASDRAVAEIRTELSIHQRRLNNGTSDTANSNSGPNSFQYLGFDIETRPKFKKGGDENPPALLQLATPTTAYLFRLSYQGMNNVVMTESLRNLLSDQTIIKVGVGIHKDVEDLKRVYGPHCCSIDVRYTSYLDLGPLAKLRWPKIQRAGLRNLTATLLGYKLSKAQQMKNWEMKCMTEAMMAYAGADALVALDLLAAVVR